MEELLARIRAFFSERRFELSLASACAIALAGAAWIAIPARRQSVRLSAEAAKLDAVIASSNSWLIGFQPASSAEPGLWQNTAYEIQSLGVRPSERVTLAQIIDRKAEEAGFAAPHIRFISTDSAGQPAARQVAGVTFNPASYRIEAAGGGGFAPLAQLIEALPPAVDLRSVNVARDSSGRVNSSVVLSVFEPTGANVK